MAKRITTELGIEKKCTGCGDFWPADKEFYHVDRASNDGLTSICKACYKERYPYRQRAELVTENF